MKSEYEHDDLDLRLAAFYEGEASEPDDEQYTLYARIRDLESRYTFVETLATGGMKKVSRVYDARADRHVAMAQLLDDADPELYEPFLREACLTARMEHPNIVSIYNIGVDGEGRPFFTMELQVGDSLSDILKKLNQGDLDYEQRYPLEELLSIFSKVCDAIAYAHSQGVLHLDLKPSNIQVASFGEVKVCDWGLGHIVDMAPERPVASRVHFDLLNTTPLFGTAHGTPGFMAPEQFEREGTVSFHTDVYALGAILYAILNLKPPFEGQPNEIMKQTLAGELPFLSHAAPEGLRAVVRKAMARQPDVRYASVEALSADVRRFLSYFPTVAESADLKRRIMLFYKRNQRVVRIVCSSLFLLVAIVAVFMAVLKDRARHILEAQQTAGESMQLYEAERDYSEQAGRNYSGDLLFITKLFSNASDYRAPEDEIIYREMLQQLVVASEHNPGDAQARVGRAILLFVLQRFNESAQVLEKTPDWARVVRELALEYGKKKPDSERLPAADLASLIREIRTRSQRPATVSLVEKLMAYDLERRPSLEERSMVVEAVLVGFNPDWQDRTYVFNPEQRSLTLGGGGLTRLEGSSRTEKPLSLLRWLRLHTLELRDVDFSILEHLRGSRLVRLDISRVTGDTYTGIFDRIEMLGELVVREGQFSEAELAGLPAYINVVVVPLEE